jgi:hypothetical protein
MALWQQAAGAGNSSYAAQEAIKSAQKLKFSVQT